MSQEVHQPMIQLWKDAEAKEPDYKVSWPPADTLVEFRLHGETEIRQGITAELEFLRPSDIVTLMQETVFVVRGARTQTRVYVLEQVKEWRVINLHNLKAK